MIGIEELQMRINEVMNIFVKRTKVLSCSLIDKDGFIIASIKPENMEEYDYNKKILSLYNAIDCIHEKDPSLFDFLKTRQLISIGVVDDFFNNGLMIIIQGIGENLVFLSLFPSLLNLNPIYEQFDKVIKEFSIYFEDPKYSEISNQLYKLV